MDSISDVAFFGLLAKQGSLTATAQELGVSTPAVSRRLANVEKRLGVRLLNRTTRRITVTYEGELYLEEGGRILDELEELEQRVSSGQATPKGLLKVNATFGFGRHVIAPVIADFVDKYPDVDVQLQLTDRPMSLTDEGVDVCIRFGNIPDARITARRIATNRRLLCASPAYLERFGTPQTPVELQKHCCIVIRESDAAYGTWHLHSGSMQETVKVRGSLTTNDGETALGWALRGHGILMRSEWNVAAYLRSGRLREVLSDWEFPPADIHAVFPMKNYLSAKIRAFVDFLEQSLTKDFDPKGSGKIKW
jgi:DNA-binding transcriptional LysR family regulator